MKRGILAFTSVVAFVLTVALAAAPLAGAAAPDGKAVFSAQKCSLCHSIDSQGIARTVKSSKAKDLSNVGAERDAAWIEKWLKKEAELDGKKHEKTWSGTPEEMTALIHWLGTLKK